VAVAVAPVAVAVAVAFAARHFSTSANPAPPSQIPISALNWPIVTSCILIVTSALDSKILSSAAVRSRLIVALFLIAWGFWHVLTRFFGFLKGNYIGKVVIWGKNEVFWDVFIIKKMKNDDFYGKNEVFGVKEVLKRGLDGFRVRFGGFWGENT
jgi:hypothetical protein